MADPDTPWEAFASREPYFAVIPASEYLRENLTSESERAFFAGGEEFVDWMFRVIEPLAPDFAPVAGLEYSCGIGRLALPLAKYAATMTAVDRSSTVLALARAEAARRNIDNIEFATSDGVFATSRKFDLVVCDLALLRLRPADAFSLVDTLVDRIGPGGVGVFHFPYDDRASRFIRLTRFLRKWVPGANLVANRVRGKAVGEPFVPTHAYPLDAMLRQLRKTSMGATHVALDQYTRVGRATVFLWMAHTSGPSRRGRRTQTDEGDPGAVANVSDRPIDVRQLIANTSIDELNRTAEGYFSSLSNWNHHLAKPFAKPDEVPPLLIDVARMIQGLRLDPGMSVLEYGAGSGWLSRYFTQLGCQATLLDVSPTALRMAQELYARLPIIGDRPPPVFLPFDGRHIDLADHSIDRIVCFHAFHHAANPDEVLREFGRVLKPGGIAAFAEPGPHHSRSAQSQFEMRTHGVVENDVNIHAIWRTARTCGFSDIRLVVFHEPLFSVSLAEFDDLLTGGPAGDAWLVSTRRFLRNARSFFLFKAGAERRDGRPTDGLACDVHAALTEQALTAGMPISIDATVTNTGQATWPPWPTHGGVALGAHLHDGAGALLKLGWHCVPLVEPSREIAPGEILRVRMALPPLAAGRYRIELDCVASQVTWFAQVGSWPVTLVLDVR